MTLPTRIPRLRIARLDDQPGGERTQAWLSDVATRGSALGDAQVRELLRERVPEYRSTDSPSSAA
jgi:hypothetical protein